MCKGDKIIIILHQNYFLLVRIVQIFKWGHLYISIARRWRYDIDTIFAPFSNILNSWHWEVLPTIGVKGLLGSSYHACFLVCVFKPILSSQWTKFVRRFDYCCPNLLVGLTYWQISWPLHIVEISLSLVTVGARGSFWPVTVFWYLYFFKYFSQIVFLFIFNIIP